MTAESLAELGAARLAELLMSAASTRPDLKRRLRMELAADQGAEALSGEIDKRLNAFETSRGRVAWRQKPAFLRDIETQRALLSGQLAALDRDAAVERLWRLMDAARPLGARIRNPADLDIVFSSVASDLGGLIDGRNREVSAVRLVESLRLNPAGWKAWLPALLDPASRDFAAAALDLAQKGGGSDAAWTALVRSLADAAGNVEAFRDSFAASALAKPAVAAAVARRYLAEERIEAAGDLLRASAPSANWRGKTPEPDPDWEAAWIDYLELSGQAQAAQDARWAGFERSLSVEFARDYTRRLPDFEDVEAERRAFDHASSFGDFEKGLSFLMAWPAFPEAAAMIEARGDTADVDPEKMEIWAAALRRRQPRAALKLLRRGAAAALRRRQFKTCERLTAEADTIDPDPS